MALPALKVIQDYLLNRKQRSKIGSSYSTWENIISGVPQGSIIGPPPLFNIFLCDLFLEHEYCCFRNYAWFASNQMKADHDKCHLLLSTQDEANIQTANTAMKCFKSKKLLGIVLDLKLDLKQP